MCGFPGAVMGMIYEKIIESGIKKRFGVIDRLMKANLKAAPEFQLRCLFIRLFVTGKIMFVYFLT